MGAPNENLGGITLSHFTPGIEPESHCLEANELTNSLPDKPNTYTLLKYLGFRYFSIEIISGDRKMLEAVKYINVQLLLQPRMCVEDKIVYPLPNASTMNVFVRKDISETEHMNVKV